MSKKPSPTADAAAELGVTKRRIRQQKTDGSLDTSKEMARLRRQEKEATIRLREAQEEQIRADLKRSARVDSGELIHIDVAVSRFVSVLAELKTQLSNLPARLAHQLRPDDPDFASKLLWAELGRIAELIQARIDQP